MAWSGYFQYAGTEVINASRVEAYADALGLYWIKQAGGSPVLAQMLGDDPYTHPVLDNAPWYDPDKPASGRFAGVVPLEVSGIEDSTRESTIFEYTSDGGNPGTLRNGTKAVTFSVALVGEDEEAVEYGFRWLKRVLLRRDCTPGTGNACKGERLVYARAIPVALGADGGVGTFDGGTSSTTGALSLDAGIPSTSDPELVVDGGDPLTVSATDTAMFDWLKNYQMHLNDVLINRGPIVNSKRNLPGCGGVVWLVSFTAVAGNPYEWGNPVTVISALTADPVVAGSPYAAPYSGGYGSNTYSIEGCASPSFQPIYDPSFPALVAPPAPPNVAPQGWVPPTGTWNRSWADIPDSEMPLWDEVRPIITVRSTGEARGVRVRFYRADVFDPTEDCGEAGEFWISYLPANVDFVIDGEMQAVYIVNGSSVRRADSLVYGSGSARPIKWFAMSCGEDWHVTLDYDEPDSDHLSMSLALAPRSA